MDTQSDKTVEAAALAAPPKKRSKVFRKGPKGSENTVAPPLPPRDPNASGPRPTRLFTVQTKPKNEPMFSDIDMMGFPGVAPYRRANDFAVTAEGLIPLCEEEYDIISTNQPYFAKNVPKSAWVYFCVKSFNARLITLKQEGDSTYEEDTFAGQILSGNHNLPAPIDAYIKALGNVVDTTSLRYKLRMPVWHSKTEDKIKLNPQTKKNAEGALALVCWTTVESVVQDTSPNVFYAESRNNEVVTAAEINARQVSYRVRKEEIGATRPYSVYAFGGYANVPVTWHATRNTVFDDGRADRWNVREYTAPFTDKSEYRLAWLKRHFK